MWLDLLVAKRRHASRLELTDHYLPPWFVVLDHGEIWEIADHCQHRDVALIFYSHLSLPVSYLSDIHYSDRYNKIAGIDFPHIKLAGPLNSDGILEDSSSSDRWSSFYPDVKYDIWSGNPLSLKNSGAVHPLTPLTLPIDCPWCHKKTRLTFDLGDEPGIRHETKCCTSSQLTDAWRTSRKTFANDVHAFISARNPSEGVLHLKSAALNPTTGENQAAVVADWLRSITVDGTSSLFQRVIDTADTITETEFEELVSAGMNNIDYSPEGELLCSTLQRVCNSYHTSTSPTNVFSVDLTQTVRGGTEKVINYVSKYFVPPTHKGYRFMVSKIDTFIGRYRRWMLLLGPDAGTGDLPPTPDMRLVWTTHLLTPVAYHSWCREELGQLVNGYVEGETDVEKAEREMDMRWEKAHVLPVRREMLRHVYEEATTNPPVMSLRERFGGEGPSGEGSGLNEFSTSGGFGSFGGGD